MAEKWLSIVEYARTFSISDMTVRRRIKTGKLKAVLKDGKYYIPTMGSTSASPSTPSQLEDKPLVHYPAIPDSNTATHSSRPSATRRAPLSDRKSEIPESIKHPLVTFETSLTNSQSLLAFCEQALARLEDQEAHLEKMHLAKTQALESKIELLQSEVNRYKQQVEDLQLLVKVFEHKNESLPGNF